MTDQTPTPNRDLARLQTTLSDLDALQRDLFTAARKPPAPVFGTRFTARLTRLTPPRGCTALTA